MMAHLARVVAGILVLVHAGLGLWAVVGFAELASPSVPWRRISNPAFSPAMLLVHWTLIALAASTFLIGFFRRWRGTPLAMFAIYGAMAVVCAYQTFAILTHGGRFLAMGIEYLEYAVILSFLFFSRTMRRRFAGADESESLRAS